MPAEVDHVLPLGPRVTSKVDLANRIGHTGIGRGAEDRERWETEAEGCIDGSEDWLNGGEEGGGGEGGESKGLLELKKAEGESRELETKGEKMAGDVAE